MSSRAQSLQYAVGQEDIRFKRYLVIGLGLFFCISSIVPFINVPEKSREEREKLPPQLTEFMLKKKPAPPVKLPEIVKPAPKQEPQIAAKPPTPKPVIQEVVKEEVKEIVIQKQAPKPEPIRERAPKTQIAEQKRVIKASEADRAQARVQASQTGVMAMQKSMSQLVDRKIETRTAKTLAKVSDTGTPRVNSAMAAASQGGSGGQAVTHISGEALASVDVNHTTETIAKSSAGQVLTSGNQLAAAQPKPAANAGPGVRDESGIRKIFEKNKSAIYSIYARAQRQNEDLTGKLVLEIKISPEGKVAEVKLIDSELQDEELVKRIMTRVGMFTFGEQKVAALTMRYTFDFVAS